MFRYWFVLALSLLSFNARADDVVAISSGSLSANGSFVADMDFSGGSPHATSVAINTANVVNPAPVGVYRDCRNGGNFTYTIPGLLGGATYLVRLHFAETYWSAAGARKFNVNINGSRALTNFDVFATSGGKGIANIQQFQALADSNGQITIQFTSVVDNAMVSGIEIALISLPPAPVYNVSLSPDKSSYAVGDAATVLVTLTGTPTNLDYDYYVSLTWNGLPLALTPIANDQSYAITPALTSGISTVTATVFLENKSQASALMSAINFYNSDIANLNLQLAAATDPNTRATLMAKIAVDQDRLAATQTQLANSRTQIGIPATLNLFAH